MLVLAGTGLIDSHKTKELEEELRTADIVFFEEYTSEIPLKKGKKLSRTDLEGKMEKIIELARDKKIVVLIPGDPLIATTHISLILEAKRKGVETKIVHGVSILSVAMGKSFLLPYKFGRIVTIPRFLPGYEPKSYVEKILETKRRGLHVLALLDRDLTIPEALRQTFSIFPASREWLCIGMARLCTQTEKIFWGEAKKLLNVDWGPIPHTLIFIGSLDPIEEEFLRELVPTVD